ncbi:outer membrane beta-barrel protein [Persicobacter diffluens]|uniref:Outer membrane protein beta-barrel domain-containing protein n=1 Tax=Persicobacter diffluens TaxID=981 RepID=A0AAN4VYR4_9BACT|nr:hypothetical protein PEDI_27800 [Persicobacter diffluens]
MMNRILFFGFFCLLPLFSFAQVEISPMVGYQLGGSIDFWEGKFKINDQVNYGLQLAYPIREGMAVELSYTRMDTDAEFRAYRGGFEDRSFDLAVQYIQLGAVRSFGQGPAEPFVLLNAGAGWASPKVNDIDDEWRFSVMFGGGLKYWFNDQMALKFQARMMMPLYFAGGGIYGGIGTGGPSAGVSVGSTAIMVQGDFSLGLSIRLGQ